MPDHEDPPKHPKRIASPGQTFVFAGDKQFKKLQKKAWDAGWWPAEKRNGIMWLAPDGAGQVMVHRTSSDHHAYDNSLGAFRDAGLDA